VDGKTILNGTVAPSVLTGSVGDFYLNTATSSLYGPKTALGWGTATSLKGTLGAQMLLQTMSWGPLNAIICDNSSPTKGKQQGYRDLNDCLPFGATINKITANVTDTATYVTGVSGWNGGNIIVALMNVDASGNETLITSAASGQAFNSGIKDLIISSPNVKIDGSALFRLRVYAETNGDYPLYTGKLNGILQLNSILIEFSY
jgi:hypothetical protein